MCEIVGMSSINAANKSGWQRRAVKKTSVGTIKNRCIANREIDKRRRTPMNDAPILSVVKANCDALESITVAFCGTFSKFQEGDNSAANVATAHGMRPKKFVKESATLKLRFKFKFAVDWRVLFGTLNMAEFFNERCGQWLNRTRARQIFTFQRSDPMVGFKQTLDVAMHIEFDAVASLSDVNTVEFCSEANNFHGMLVFTRMLKRGANLNETNCGLRFGFASNKKIIDLTSNASMLAIKHGRTKT